MVYINLKCVDSNSTVSLLFKHSGTLEIEHMEVLFCVLLPLSQAQPEVGVNPVQVETGDFDEAIDVEEEEEEVTAESEQ